jgi:two-component system KDP operon response regulator KdpE
MPKNSGYILAIDDEPAIQSFIQRNLQLAGFYVYSAYGGQQGMQLTEETALDMILLDLNLPDMDGLEVLRQLRRRHTVPIIIISARDDEESVVSGLNLGADDYLVKPFSGRALQARIEAVLRRSQRPTAPSGHGIYEYEHLVVDIAARHVTVNGERVGLTPIEFDLLIELIRTAGRVRLHSDLLTSIWGPDYRDDVTVLRATIYRLRQKIERDPAKPVLIRTESGVGYSFARPNGSSPALVNSQLDLPRTTSDWSVPR